jgi:hypothetical protein
LTKVSVFRSFSPYFSNTLFFLFCSDEQISDWGRRPLRRTQLRYASLVSQSLSLSLFLLLLLLFQAFSLFLLFLRTLFVKSWSTMLWRNSKFLSRSSA